ncbi:PAS domain-containing protein [Oceanibaculum pacificum]|uniref:PAS domain-containing protein n=1 Tax=Oceanibaculum pacificum TaxID=580166 RepID=A0A154WF16_9PROT|nr:PAS domain-containing protein [Oceanibaculum pacificum]KZD12089.1 hypothetical protein AUP43_05485 [Oceanibaculum pacificum]
MLLAGKPVSSFAVASLAGDALPDERLRGLFLYWRDKHNPDRAEAFLPGRAAIDPLDFPRLLPNIMLQDVEPPGPRRFRFRVFGTEIARTIGLDGTGRYTEDLLPSPYLDYVLFINQQVIDTRRALYSETPYHEEGKASHSLTYRLLLPLAANGRDVDMILACQYFAFRGNLGDWEGDWLNLEPRTLLLD